MFEIGIILVFNIGNLLKIFVDFIVLEDFFINK